MSKRRCYTLTGEDAERAQQQVGNLTWPNGEPLRLGDFGTRLRLSGALYQGEGYEVLLLSPSASDSDFTRDTIIPRSFRTDCGMQLPLEDWESVIRQTDDPVVFELDPSGMIKAVHRKIKYQISAGVQWTIWARDGFRCMYCGLAAGSGVPLTVDHVIPLQRGGTDAPDNYLSSCRRCGKSKGARDFTEWCESQGLDQEGLELYLNGKAPASFIGHLQEDIS